MSKISQVLVVVMLLDALVLEPLRAHGILHPGEQSLKLRERLDLAHIKGLRRLQAVHVQREHHLPERRNAEVALQDAVDVACASRVGQRGDFPRLSERYVL